MYQQKRLVIGFLMFLLFSIVVQPMIKKSHLRKFIGHIPIDESSFSLFNNLVRNVGLCKRRYNVLHHHQGFRSYNELLYRANNQLCDVRILQSKCHQLYRDEQFILAMAKDPSLDKRVQDLRQELDGERIKLETFKLIVKKMQKPGPL